MLYQLSYSRNASQKATALRATPSWQSSEPMFDEAPNPALPRHGGEGNRTPDLLNAIQALSQLSYAPSSHRPHKCNNDSVLNGYRQEPRTIAMGIASVNEIGLAKIWRAGILQRLL